MSNSARRWTSRFCASITETKKIGLSARAVGKDEPIVDTKIYSSEAGGGMASLGELADFPPSKPDTNGRDRYVEEPNGPCIKSNCRIGLM